MTPRTPKPGSTQRRLPPSRDGLGSQEMLELTRRQLEHIALVFALVFVLAMIPSVVEAFENDTMTAALWTKQIVGWLISLCSPCFALLFYWKLRRRILALARMPEYSLAFGVFGAFSIARAVRGNSSCSRCADSVYVVGRAIKPHSSRERTGVR